MRRSRDGGGEEPGHRQPVMAVLQGPASLPLTWSKNGFLSSEDAERHAIDLTIDKRVRSLQHYD
jgi:hypothetical protein